MVGEGADADAATARFCAYWEDTAALAGSVLVYNTGRSLGQFTALWAEKAGALALPDVLITAVGTKARTAGVACIRNSFLRASLRHLAWPSGAPGRAASQRARSLPWHGGECACCDDLQCAISDESFCEERHIAADFPAALVVSGSGAIDREV
jgi:hypothetical protein